MNRLEEGEQERLNNQADAFEEFAAASLSQTDIDALLKHGDIPAGLLCTNEYADLTKLKRKMSAPPDGYIYGVGAGNIFSMSLLFDKENPPKAILSVDMFPEAVLAGRIFVDLMRDSNNFDDFVKKLQSKDAFVESAGKVIQEEKSPKMASVLEEIDLTRLFDLIDDVIWRAFMAMPKDGFIQESSMYNDKISVLAAIRGNWDVLKQLADEHNIGFGVGNFFNTATMDFIKSRPDFDTGRNLVYTSNTIDYVRCKEGHSDPRWDAMRNTFAPLDAPNNTFVFSSVENDLNLFASEGIPESAPRGFWMGDRR